MPHETSCIASVLKKAGAESLSIFSSTFTRVIWQRSDDQRVDIVCPPFAENSGQSLSRDNLVTWLQFRLIGFIFAFFFRVDGKPAGPNTSQILHIVPTETSSSTICPTHSVCVPLQCGFNRMISTLHDPPLRVLPMKSPATTGWRFAGSAPK